MLHKRPLIVLIVSGMALGTAVEATSAQSPPAGSKPPAKTRALDQQLLDDLDRELLKDLPGATQQAGDEIAPSRPGGMPARSGAKGNHDDPSSIDSNSPFAKIAQRMRSVENRIARHDTSITTQEEQDQIINDIDALLDAAKKGRNGGKKETDSAGSASHAGVGTGDNVPGSPRDSTNRIEHGSKESVETADVKDVLQRFWGHLPQRLRDEMQTSFSEQFLPKYERVIEEYYKRLAEERPDGP